MKTEVMHQPTPRKPYVEPNININAQRFNLVDKFTDLGITLSRTFVIDDEINTRLAKASAAFGRLHKNVWDRRGITTETKIKVYKAVVLTTMLLAVIRGWSTSGFIISPTSMIMIKLITI